MSLDFAYHSQRFVARPSGALFWPAKGALIVADLHLGKSERMARRGGALLPPFETGATLDLLTRELEESGAQRLICLGDSFDDEQAHAALGADLAMLERICARITVTWITGNHDPAPRGLPGHVTNEMMIARLALRHIAGEGPDISGHYHPKLKIAGIRVPVFLIGTQHLILPAFGTYTGGLDHDAPVLKALVPRGYAILTGRKAQMVPLPLPRPAAGRGSRVRM